MGKLGSGPLDQPLAVVGITHPQSCIILRGRLRALKEAGFRVVLICSSGAMADDLASHEGALFLSIPMQRTIAPLADMVSVFRLWRVLRELSPALTEFSTPKAGLLGNIAAWLCGVPARVYFLRGLRFETSRGLQRILLKAMERLAAACAHVVLCNSESLRRQVCSLGIAPEGKLRVIGCGSSNGVDTVRFAPGPDRMRPQLGITAEVPVVGYVGRLTQDKGIPDLVEAFNQLLAFLPHTRLLLVGWFDESEDALSVFQRAKIEAHPRIVCTGFVPDTAPYYRAMDLLVLPTWREGFPNVALEAAASGLPVITTLSTGARDAVLSGVTGLRVPPGDAFTLSEAMLILLQHPGPRLAMGRAARHWVTQQFMKRRVLGNTTTFYKQLLRDAEEREAARQPAAMESEVKDAAAVAD
ncbi:MAG TPA: glycosyltransferase family 4 protein [Terracidiphilus sp.]|jgi:glycosyltransferase involved in cell wall biosynthesis